MIHTSMFQKHIHKVKFYPSADDFSQALLVMLVTNIVYVFQTLLSKVSVISKKKSKIVSICSCALVTYKLFHLPKRLQSYLLQHWMRARRTFQSFQLQVVEKGSFAMPSSNTQSFDAERIKDHRVPKRKKNRCLRDIVLGLYLCWTAGV